MTGCFIQTGFRHICLNSTAALKNVADHSKRCGRQVSASSTKEKSHEIQNKNTIMYFSDDSQSYVTTASQDERIEQKLQQEKEENEAIQELLDCERQEIFEEVFQEKDHQIFHLPGLTFLKFTHMKIKFYFEPCKVVTFVKKDVKFYCSLKYYKKYGVWNIRRDSFPANYKLRIYNIFYRDDYFSVTDETVANAIYGIYVKLQLWAEEEEQYRKEKFKRYQNGEEVELDTDDEELFLTEEERKELKDKREKVLKRMIPPKDKPELPPERRKRLLPPERPKKKRREVSPEYTPPRRIRRRRVFSTTDSD